MNELPKNTENPGLISEQEALEILRQLRQKQGNWVGWGSAIAQLQKSGYNPQKIFEETGFEPVQQNQVVVGSQVYSSLIKGSAQTETLNHFQGRGSDVLYEFRLLTNEERVSAAELAFKHNIDCDEAREVARAIKDFSRFRNPPEGFTNHPGDAIAYQSWKLARQNSDLQVRSRLIAKGLKYAHSDSARKQIEQLLTDFTVDPKKNAPTLPFYRIESASEIPRMIPVVGELPLTLADLRAVPLLEAAGKFNVMKFAGEQAWVALPGWQILRAAEDPVGILCSSDRFPRTNQTAIEPVLVIIDRAQRQWDALSYFAIEDNTKIDFQWFEGQPEIPLHGKIIIIVRPKTVLDEEFNKDVWQIEE